MNGFSIVGAGLSGLIAAAVLRNRAEVIYDSQSELPNNHAALLRFRSSVVGDAVGIPFREVDVMKTSSPWKNPVADAISYSRKVTGRASFRSSVTANGKVEKRFIAPDDFIQKVSGLSTGKFCFSTSIEEVLDTRPVDGRPIISTIPMPSLMDVLGYDRKPEFSSIEGFTISFDLGPEFDICATVYVPDPSTSCYRISITGRRVILEFTGMPSDLLDNSLWVVENLCDAMLGIKINISEVFLETKANLYSKISPISEAERKRFLVWATENHRIYALGRFATWRPGLLLDDLIDDVRKIVSMENGSIDPLYKARMS